MQPRNNRLNPPLLALGLFLIFNAPIVLALVGEIDFGDGVDLSDDNGIYVTVLARYSGRDLAQVQQVYDLCPDKDDLPVILDLAAATGKSPGFILALRGQKVSWWEISVGLEVDANDWFLPVTQTPRPPYAIVYDNWKAAGEGGRTLWLSDDDCRNLAAARFLHRYFQVTVARAMEMRVGGAKLEKVAADEVRRRQGSDRFKARKVADGSSS